jgi:uncharacterized protein YjdB
MLTFHADPFSSAGHAAPSSSGPIFRGRTRLLPLGISAFLAFLLSACSGSSDPVIVGDSPTSQARGTLQVEPASFTLSEGGTISLRAKLGSQTVGASQLTWSVSPSSVASIDAHGVVKAIKHGEAVVTARYSSLQATAQATVWPIPQNIEALTSTSLAGIVGRPVTGGLKVRAVSSEGVPVPGVEVTFEVLSGNGSLSHAVRATGTDGVARVDWTMGTVPGQQQARARAGLLGEFTFGAEVAPDYGTATVEIVAGDGQEAQVVTFLPEPLMARLVDRFGNVLPGLAVEWGFSDGGGSNGVSGSPGSTSPVVSATTDSQGMTAVFWKLGTQAGIQAALCTPSAGPSGGSGGEAGSGPSPAPPGHAVAKGFRAKASPAEADGEDVIPEESLTVVEATHQLLASLVDQYGNAVEGGSFVWTSDQSGVVAVDNTGLAYGLKVGKAEVFAEDSSSKLKGSAWVKVEARVASTLQRRSGDGQKGVVGTPLPNPVAVRVLDQVGSPVEGVSVAWSVMDGPASTAGLPGSAAPSAGEPSAAVTVTDSDGIAQTSWTLGTTAGEQRLQASAEGVSPVVFTADATPGLVASVQVTPPSADIEVGKSQQFSAAALDEFGNLVTGASFTWSSSDASVATVLETGLASGAAAGSADIRAVSGGVMGSARSTVEPADTDPQVATVIISPSEVTLTALGETAQLAAVGHDPSGNPISDAIITWSTPDSSIATVDQMGMVTAKAVGSALIVASASCCQAADTVEVKVTQIPTEVMISPSSQTLAAGEVFQFSAVVKDAMGYVVPDLEVTWSSENASVATVDENGQVTGREGGITHVQADFSGLTSLATVTVTEGTPPPPGSTVEPFFFDGFESGDLSKKGGTEGRDFRWSSKFAVDVVSSIKRSGTYSVRYTYENGVNANPEHAYAHLTGSFDPVSGPNGLWVEYYVYFPDGSEIPSVGPAVYHRSFEGSHHNQWKIWRAYAQPYVSGPTAGFDFVYPSGNGGDKAEPVYRDVDGVLWGSWKLNNAANALPGISGSPEGAVPRGQWVQFRFHVKEADEDDSFDGKIQFWVNGNLIWSRTDLDLRGNKTGDIKHYWDTFYIFNWASMGFEHITYIYVDDVRAYDSDPGW